MGASSDNPAGRSPRRPFRHGWVPYAVPYVAFLVVVQAQAWLPAGAAAWLLPVRVALPAALFGLAWWRGAFPELRTARGGAAGWLADAALGLGVAALWMAPYVAGWLPRPGAEHAFDPDALGPDLRAAALALRAAGFALVTPFVEELFVRSFLLRAVELVSWRGGHLEIDASRDFRDLPVARYTAWGFWLTVAWFALSHAPWELPVAAATGAIYNLWLYRRGHLRAVVRAHAVTNAALFAAVLAADAGGADLWYFL